MWVCSLLIIASFLVTVNSLHSIYDSIVPPTANYPHYYLYLHENKSFVPRYIKLPDDAPSLKSDFATAPSRYKFQSFSQTRQDITVLAILQDLENGYFVDLAANDYIKLSNTFMFEQFNHWNGICIEPNPEYWVGHLSNRRCKLYVNPVSHGSGETIPFRFQNVYGGIVGEEFDQRDSGKADPSIVHIVTTTLTDMLDHVKAPRSIQYMSLDIEGAEYVAMVGLDFSKYTIWIITIERPKAKLHHLLVKNGYVFFRLLNSFGECLYIHYSMPNFDTIYSKESQRDVPEIFGNTRKDLLEPEYRGNSTAYLIEANELYEKNLEMDGVHKHHHSATGGGGKEEHEK